MISICIPTYEMHGRGFDYFVRCIKSIKIQTYTDYEIVVSDNSKNDDIFDACVYYKVRYIYNSVIGMASNTNNAIKNAKGWLIKILYQDDCFANSDCLQDIIDNFGNSQWLITGCSNNPHPYWNDRVVWGNNTLGSPSCLTLRGKEYFSNNLKWVLDCELYNRLYKKYGEPKILDKVNIIMGLGDHQATNHLSDEEKRQELEEIGQKGFI